MFSPRAVAVRTRMTEFLQRDTMHKRGYSRHAVSVCPSVHPSVTFVDHCHAPDCQELT